MSLIDLNNAISTEMSYNVDICVLIEHIIALSLLLILQMTQISKLSINFLISQNFIQFFLQNEPAFSELAKRVGFYALSNIILEMHDITFDAFYKGIMKKLADPDPIIQNSGYAKILFIIDDESNCEYLQTSVFRLLNVICYRISTLENQNDISINFSKSILSRIYDQNSFFDIPHTTQNSRRELLYAVYRLCCAFPNVSSIVLSDPSKIQPFKNCFLSSNDDDVEFALNFFCLIFSECQDLGIRFQIMKLIPWEKLKVRIENHHSSYNILFFKAIEMMSSNKPCIEEFWNNGVYSKIISYDDFHIDTKNAACKMFMQILMGNANFIPPEVYMTFVQNGILHVFFDILDLECECTDQILDCLHIINQKLILISKVGLVAQEYAKLDAVSILQEDVPNFQEKAFLLCQEIGLVNN